MHPQPLTKVWDWPERILISSQWNLYFTHYNYLLKNKKRPRQCDWFNVNTEVWSANCPCKHWRKWPTQLNPANLKCCKAIFCCFHFPSCIFGFWKHLKRNKLSCHTLLLIGWLVFRQEERYWGGSTVSQRQVCVGLVNRRSGSSVICCTVSLACETFCLVVKDDLLSQRENSHLLWTIFRFGIVSILSHQCHLHFEVLFLRWLPSCCGACQDNHHGHKQSKSSFKDILKAKIKVKRSRLALTTSHSYKLQRWQPADLFASVGNQNKKKEKKRTDWAFLRWKEHA